MHKASTCHDRIILGWNAIGMWNVFTSFGKNIRSFQVAQDMIHVRISMKHVCHFCHIFMFVTSVCKALLLISPKFFDEFKFVTLANIMLSSFRYPRAVIRRQMNTLYYFWSNNLKIYHQRCQTVRNIAWKSSTQCPLLPHVCLPENVFVAIHLSLLRISGHDALK